MFQLREYQRQAIDAVNDYLRSDSGNPLVQSATGTGKTVIFSTMILEWLEAWPTSRILILTHQRELLQQAKEKILSMNAEVGIGIYCAGLKERDATQSITLASIQSIHSKGLDFEPWDIVIIDECHLVPNHDSGQYRRFLDGEQMKNPDLRVIGFTATPYRLDGGYIAGEGVFDQVIFETDLVEMIREGFLCKLSTKATEARIDVTGVKIRNGDFAENELQERANDFDLVARTVGEIKKRAEGRHSILIFCCGVEHAHHVAGQMNAIGVKTETITGETDKDIRADILNRFGDPNRSEPMAVTNVSVLTTGLDITRIDCIGVLRPTQSPSRHVQQIGRGLRTDPLKGDCLVLDFAGNTDRLGPINDVQVRKPGKDGNAPTKTCPECDEIIGAALMQCPECGHEFIGEPKEAKHEVIPSGAPIIDYGQAQTWERPSVSVFRHKKQGKPDSLKVVYRNGINTVSEWVCLDHTGYAKTKAGQWWIDRDLGEIPTVDEALIDLFLSQRIERATKSVTWRKDGKYKKLIKTEISKDAIDDSKQRA